MLWIQYHYLIRSIGSMKIKIMNIVHKIFGRAVIVGMVWCVVIDIKYNIAHN